MFKTDPSIYHKCVIIENRHTTLYFQLQKSLYECLRRKFIFYENMVRDLESKVFFINPYNPYVAKITINRIRMKITWYIKDLKLTLVNAGKVTETIEWMKQIYGK